MTAAPFRKLSTALSATLVISLAGCALQTDVPPLPQSDIPAGFVMLPEAVDIAWPQNDWWQNFQNAELTSLINLVQASNLSLANNRRNLEAAQLTLRDADFNLLPRLNIGLGTGINYQESRINGQSASGSQGQPFELGATISYTDLLAKPAVYTQSLANYTSRAAAVADITLNTLGTSASTYFQLMLIRDRIEAAQQNVDNA